METFRINCIASFQVTEDTMDEAKSLAVETVFGVGSSDSSSSLVELFRNSKFKDVVSSEQSIFKKYSKKYLSEVYSLSDYIYIGGRRKNLPYNVNLAWSKYNAIDFEIMSHEAIFSLVLFPVFASKSWDTESKPFKK